MKTFIYRNCIGHSSRIMLLVSILLALAGCGETPESAPVEKVGISSDSQTDSADDGDKSSEDETEPIAGPEQPAKDVEKQKVVVDVPAFLDAALEGRIENVRQDIQAGVDVNATDDQQRTALLFAAFNGHTPVVKLLLENGALLEQRDSVGRSALMFAATGANAETVELLLDKGAQVNVADKGEGFTALMHAAAEGQVEVVRLLLKHNADPALVDTDGDNAQDFAAQKGHSEIVRLLTK